MATVKPWAVTLPLWLLLTVITGVSFYSHPPFDCKEKYLEQIRRNTNNEQCLGEFYKTLRCLESRHSVCCYMYGFLGTHPIILGVLRELWEQEGGGKAGPSPLWRGPGLVPQGPAWWCCRLTSQTQIQAERCCFRLWGSGKTPASPAFSLLTGIITSVPRNCCENQMKWCVWEGIITLYHTINTQT